ncbi:MAG TPA: PAS domain S-box protein [Opitutaceae bacterium]|nr:PAS domain S-box protein [Opitutaceae bacterium]
MPQATRSAAKDPTATALPPDVVGATVARLNDVVIVTEASPVDEPGPRILFVNPAFEKMTGYTSEEVVGRSPRFLSGPGTSKPDLLRIEAALRSRAPVRAELLNYRKDGTPFWVEIVATPMASPPAPGEYTVFIERDVTERKRAEEALREQERAMATLFSNLPGMAYRCRNDGYWTMEFVSDGCRELTGYDPEAIIGNRLKSFEEIIDPEDRKAVRESNTRTLERSEAFELTYRIRTREGAVKWVLERGRSVPGPDGHTRHFEGFVTDITERKLLELQVVQNQRLESIGTLAGGIAHDLNNVFAPIMMAGELLSDKSGDSDSGQLLEVISASARRGAELVRQILLFARGLEGQRVALTPSALLAEIQTFLDSTLPKSIRINIDVAPGLPEISGDPTQLHQVLLNLCVNARDAMPSGGRLAISAERAHVPPSAPRPHPDAVPGDFVRIDVADTGCGIPDILKGQIFDPFFTTKGVGRGTGLGLSTARSIVKSHRGFVTFHSTEGAGTTFSVFLPTAAAGLSPQTRDDHAKTDLVPLPRGKGEHILVVDDEVSVRLIMRSTLENFGFRVSTASDGAEAIALFRNPSGQFDLALVDMQMPGLDGGKTIVALRHLRPGLPIMGASGLATSEDREHAAANGVRHFLEKPFSVETLIRTVHAAMAKTAA